MKYLTITILDYSNYYLKILNKFVFILLALCLPINYCFAEENTYNDKATTSNDKTITSSDKTITSSDKTITSSDKTTTSNDNATINVRLLRDLQNSYFQLINFPKQKQQDLASGKAVVSKFAGNAVNLSQLIKVLDQEETKYFINTVITKYENKIASSPGKDVADAIEIMLSKDNKLARLNDQINQFNADMTSKCLDKVINYAVAQNAIDKESKKIINLTIKPNQQIIDNLPQTYKNLFENSDFNEKMIEKLLDIMPNVSIIKLPLIRDTHKIRPIVSPSSIVNRPYLEQYFEDDFGNILTSKKQINLAAEQLLPKTDVSSILNSDASCILIENITNANSFNYYKVKKNINADYILKQWMYNSIDNFNFEKGYLSYKIPQKEDKTQDYNLILDAEIYAMGAHKLLNDFSIDLYYAYATSNVIEQNNSKTNIHSVCRLFCLKGSYIINNFILSCNSCYGISTNKGTRIDRKYFRHNHTNSSKIYNVNLNLDYSLVLDKYWSFIPSLFSKYSCYINNKYTETSQYTDTSILDCVVKPNNYNYLSIGIGTIIQGKFIASGLHIDPKLIFSILYNKNCEKNSSFNATLCGIDIKRRPEDAYRTKASFVVETSIFSTNITCNIKYILEIYSKYNSNLIFFEFRYSF